MSKTIRIIQNLVEPLTNSSFINKLYKMIVHQETYNENIYDTTNTTFIGTISVPHTYETYITKIRENFPRLTINSLDYYILFEDSEVERILVNTYGDGTGMTYAQAAAVTSFDDILEGNRNITSFNELRYFTGLSITPRFSNCENLISIDLPPNIKTIYNYSFYNCPSLQTIGDITNIELIRDNAFKNCSNLIFEGSFINLTTGSSISGVKGFTGEAVFDGTFTSFSVGGTDATKIEIKGRCESCRFDGVTKCKTFILPETTLQVVDRCFRYCYAIENVIIKATTPPTCGTDIFANTNNKSKKIYVPDESVDAYKVADGWLSYASNIYPVSEFVE